MSNASFRFPQSSRLRLRREINALFQSGRVHRVFPFMVHVSTKPYEGSAVRMAVSVPKRRIKKAVDRNRVKRLIREAFRLNAPRFWSQPTYQQTMHLAIVFLGKEVPDFKTVSAKIILTLQRLTVEHEANNDRHNDGTHTALP